MFWTNEFRCFSFSKGESTRGRLARAALLLALLVLSPALSAAEDAEGADLPLRVRVYDYVDLPPRVLAAARKNAEYILAGAGIKILWEQCRVRGDDANQDASCRQPLSASDIQLRIIRQEMAQKVSSSEQCLGFAWLFEGGAGIGAVFHHRVEEMQDRNVSFPAPLLGGVMAHEIGHLLLKDLGHGATGIMKAAWREREMKSLATGRLLFTDKEALRIQAEIRSRLRPGLLVSEDRR